MPGRYRAKRTHECGVFIWTIGDYTFFFWHKVLLAKSDSASQSLRAGTFKHFRHGSVRRTPRGVSTNIDRYRPNIDYYRPISTGYRPISTNIDRISTNIDQYRPVLTDIDQYRPISTGRYMSILVDTPCGMRYFDITHWNLTPCSTVASTIAVSTPASSNPI